MVSKEQWLEAQKGEINHHVGNFNLNEGNRNHYNDIYRNVFKFVDPNFNFDVKNKKILEIGPGVFAALLYCANTQNSFIVEPLDLPENVKQTYTNKGIGILKGAVEDLDLPEMDEVWVFNVMQHIWNPDVFVAKLKKNAKKILFFEPINTPIDNLHVYTYSLQDFQRYFGDTTVHQFNGGSIPHFHTANCAYGIWDKSMELTKNIGVIGIGKLGLCFALSLEKAGYNVCGVDISPEYVSAINLKQYKTSEPLVENFLQNSRNFLATTDLKIAVDMANTIFTVVATPSLPDGNYDHSQLQSVCNKLKDLGVQETTKHLVVCCTVMPGFTDVLQKELEPFNWLVSYNPEFIAQGTVIYNQENPDMILIGEANVEAGNQLEGIYHRFCKNNPRIHRMSRLSAELTKIGLNCFLVTKIAYANMMGDIAETLGAETDKILNAIGDDSRVGHKFLKYGFGFGGPCTKPNQLIQTNKGLKSINEIKIGDKVLTHKGRYREVIKIYARPYTGNMCEIYTSGFRRFNCFLTPNHPVFVQRKNGTHVFIPAGCLLPTDKIIFPSLKNESEINSLLISYLDKRPFKKEVSIKITPSIMKMFGFFLSEGCVSNSNKHRREDRIIFTFHKKEMDYAIFVKNIFKEFFNRKVLIKEKKNQNSIVAVSKNVPLAKWFLNNFGKGSQNKKVPYEWLNLPDEYLKELLKGIWYGDGSKSGNVYTLGITSRELINFVSLCLFKFEIRHTITKQYTKIDKNNIKHKECYYLKIADSQNIKKMSDILLDMKINLSNKQVVLDNQFQNGFVKYKIEKINKNYYDGLVYNLEVDEDESYVLENCVVHNCLPRDARALGMVAQENGCYANIPLAADESNKLHLTKQVDLLEKKISTKDNPIFFNSVTYKPESILIEESQQLKLAAEMAKRGYKTIINERKEVVEAVKNEYGDLFTYQTRTQETNKKVISFTLFGTGEIYLQGAIENAKLAPIHYPDWECRFYVEPTIPNDIKKELKELGANVIEKTGPGGYSSLFWRFEPINDKNVDVWVSRDVDSRLCAKEALAVKDWLNSGKTFHLMRDSHNHDLYPIMAGMFGVRNDLTRTKYPNINFNCPNDYHQRDVDQLALQNQIWHLVEKDHICHEHWAHVQPVSKELSFINGRDPNVVYQGQGVYGHVTNRRRNYPHHFAEGSINRPFPLHPKMEYGLYLGQRILENNKPVWNEEVQWEYELRGEKW